MFNKLTNNKRIHTVDPYKGKVMYSREVDDYFVLLTLPNEKGDELMLIEMLIAPEISQTDNKVEKPSLQALMCPLVTNIKFKGQIKGMKLMQSKGIEKLILISKEHEITVLELKDIKRVEVNEIKKQENKLPEELRFKYPMLMEYNKEGTVC